MDAILATKPNDPQLAPKGDKAEWQLGLAKALRETGSIREARKVLTDCIAELDHAMHSGAVPNGEATRANAAGELGGISKI